MDLAYSHKALAEAPGLTITLVLRPWSDDSCLTAWTPEHTHLHRFADEETMEKQNIWFILEEIVPPSPLPKMDTCQYLWIYHLWSGNAFEWGNRGNEDHSFNDSMPEIRCSTFICEKSIATHQRYEMINEQWALRNQHCNNLIWKRCQVLPLYDGAGKVLLFLRVINLRRYS